MTSAQPIILHHFERSPFSEKVRLTFGLKGIEWTSCLQSRIMPRPDLTPMTGGYRRTPTLQIGADIYCDTQIILRELQRRHPEPTLYPGASEGLCSASAMWTDRVFFQNTVNLVFGSIADKVPQEFIADREQLRGQKFDVPGMTAAIPQMRDQFRAHVDWIDRQLADGRRWLLGSAASLLDINAYMNVWYVRSNLEEAETLIGPFRHARAWEDRVRAIGHGKRVKEIAPAEALAIGRAATPLTPAQADPGDPNGLKPGDKVKVVPDDYGKVPVTGTIVSSSAQHIALRRQHERAGEVVIHFPRAGFLVVPG